MTGLLEKLDQTASASRSQKDAEKAVLKSGACLGPETRRLDRTRLSLGRAAPSLCIGAKGEVATAPRPQVDTSSFDPLSADQGHTQSHTQAYGGPASGLRSAPPSGYAMPSPGESPRPLVLRGEGC